MLETACSSQTRFPSLAGHDWSKDESLYKILSEEYGVVISAIDQTIKPALLTETEAHYIKSKAGSPVLLSETIAYTREGIPVEYSWSFSAARRARGYQ
jgi:GntR family transcriptional regulator